MEVTIVFWLVIGAIVISSIYFRHSVAISRNRVIEALAEKDRPLPPGLFQETRRPWDGRHFTAAGIILIGAGMAAVLFFWAMSSPMFGSGDHERWLPFVGAFPLCIGAACLVVGRFIKPND